jgi:hypothetical protein
VSVPAAVLLMEDDNAGLTPQAGLLLDLSERPLECGDRHRGRLGRTERHGEQELL